MCFIERERTFLETDTVLLRQFQQRLTGDAMQNVRAQRAGDQRAISIYDPGIAGTGFGDQAVLDQ